MTRAGQGNGVKEGFLAFPTIEKIVRKSFNTIVPDGKKKKVKYTLTIQPSKPTLELRVLET